MWNKAKQDNNILSYKEYFKTYPTGKYRNEAGEKIRILDEKQVWENCLESASISKFEEYLKNYSKGEYTEQAIEKIKSIKEEEAWEKAKGLNHISEYSNYLATHPHGQNAKIAEEFIIKLDNEAWESTLEKIKIALNNYIEVSSGKGFYIKRCQNLLKRISDNNSALLDSQARQKPLLTSSQTFSDEINSRKKIVHQFTDLKMPRISRSRIVWSTGGILLLILLFFTAKNCISSSDEPKVLTKAKTERETVERPDIYFEGLRSVQDSNNLWGFKDTNNILQIPFVFDSVNQFTGGVCEVVKNGIRYKIDKANEPVLQEDDLGFVFDSINPRSNHYMVQNLNGIIITLSDINHSRKLNEKGVSTYNGVKYYNYNTAKQICPKGWHLLSKADLNKLIETYDEAKVIDLLLPDKSYKGGWPVSSDAPHFKDENSHNRHDFWLLADENKKEKTAESARLLDSKRIYYPIVSDKKHRFHCRCVKN